MAGLAGALASAPLADGGDTVSPTIGDLTYGPHEPQRLDFYRAPGTGPRPLVVHIHGGGWNAYDKSTITMWQLDRYLAAGVSVAAIDYRYNWQAIAAGVTPPVSWPLGDAARAVQFLRLRAEELGVDNARVGAQGFSAGGSSALWLALHDDMAEPESDDLVTRQSTRLAAVAVADAQTSLDPRQMRKWIPAITYGAHAFGFVEGSRKEAFEQWLEARDRLLPVVHRFSPFEHASRDDPPVYLRYARPPSANPQSPGAATHSAVFGVKLAERLREAGGEVILSYPGHEHPTWRTPADFLIDQLR